MLKILLMLMIINSVWADIYRPLPMKYLWSDKANTEQVKLGLEKQGRISSGFEGITSFFFDENLSGKFYHLSDSSLRLIVEKDNQYTTEALTEFFDLVLKSDVLEENISLNPYYFYEEKLAKKEYRGKELTNYFLIEREDYEAHRTRNSLLLLPDTHGDQKKIEILNTLIDGGSVDWIGLEMLHAGFDLNTYDLNEMIYEMRTYLDAAWMSFWPENKGPYLDLIKKAMKAGVKVISLDYDIVRYRRLDGNHEQANLIFRNYYWSQQIPQKGAGVIFGGSSHFDEQTFPLQSFQNYVRLNSERKILKIKEENQEG